MLCTADVFQWKILLDRWALCGGHPSSLFAMQRELQIHISFTHWTFWASFVLSFSVFQREDAEPSVESQGDLDDALR